LIQCLEQFERVAILPSNQSRKALASRYPDLHVKRSIVSVGRTGGLTKYVASFLFAADSSRLVAKLCSDKQTAMYGHGASAAIAFRLSGTRSPLVLDLFETELPYVMTKGVPALSGIGQMLESVVFNIADSDARKVFVLSDAMRTYISKKYAIHKPVEVAYDSAECDSFVPVAVDDKFGNKSIVYVGDIYRRDGLKVLIASLPEILKSVPTAMLHVIGDGPLLPEVMRQTRQMGIDRHVKFYGWVRFEYVCRKLPSMLVGVAPASDIDMNRLTVPRKIYDYMAAGVVPVASNLPSIGEVVKDHISGLLTKPDDPIALIDPVTRLLSDKSLYEKLQRGAIRRAEELDLRFQTQKIATALRESLA
jgi:glycosyltransferase involved in cell wall biosynthesis